jgi:hypothetical protein
VKIQKIFVTKFKLKLAVTCGLLLVLLVACSNPAITSTIANSTLQSESTSISVIPEQEGPVLSDTLKRAGELPVSGNFGNVGIPEGQLAVDFTLNDTNGGKVCLSDLLKEKPVVMVLGSYT